MRRRTALGLFGATVVGAGCLEASERSGVPDSDVSSVPTVWPTPHGDAGRTRAIPDGELTLDEARLSVSVTRASGTPSSPPVVGDGTLYYTTSSELVAHGRNEWRVDAPGSGIGPTLHDGVVYSHAGRSLRAHTARDGTELWRREVPAVGGLHPSPATATVGSTLLTTTRTRVVGIDLDTGETWRADHGTEEPLVLAATASGVVTCGLAPDGLHVAGFSVDGHEQWEILLERSNPGVDVSVCCAGERTVIFTQDGTLLGLDTVDGTRLWERDLSWGYAAAPTVSDGRVVVPPAHDETTVSAYDLASGETIWSRDVGRETHSLTSVGDTVLVPTDDPQSRLLQLSLEDGSVESSAEIVIEPRPRYGVSTAGRLTVLRER